MEILKFCVRIDDLGWSAEEIHPPPMKAPDRGLVLAQRFHVAMDGLPYLGGIIPASLDDAGLAWLATNPAGLTVALHGWNHMRCGTVDSEFHTLDIEQCRERLDCGRSLLRRYMKIDTEHFIPPFNAVTPTLIDACYHEGLRTIWGAGAHDRREPSAWATSPQPYALGRVTFVPSWAPLYGATRWRMGDGGRPLLDVVPALLPLPGLAVLTLHLPWQAAHEPNFESVRRLADMIADHVISPAEYLEAPR